MLPCACTKRLYYLYCWMLQASWTWTQKGFLRWACDGPLPLKRSTSVVFTRMPGASEPREPPNLSRLLEPSPQSLYLRDGFPCIQPAVTAVRRMETEVAHHFYEVQKQLYSNKRKSTVANIQWWTSSTTWPMCKWVPKYKNIFTVYR